MCCVCGVVVSLLAQCRSQTHAMKHESRTLSLTHHAARHPFHLTNPARSTSYTKRRVKRKGSNLRCSTSPNSISNSSNICHTLDGKLGDFRCCPHTVRRIRPAVYANWTWFGRVWASHRPTPSSAPYFAWYLRSDPSTRAVHWHRWPHPDYSMLRAI